MKEQWRQQMQQKMAGYRQPAPEVSWEEIDKALSANRRQARVVPLWTRRVAAAVLVLVAVGLGWRAWEFRQTEEPKPLTENVTGSAEGQTVEETAAELAAPTAEPLLAAATPKAQPSTESSEEAQLVAAVEQSEEVATDSSDEESQAAEPEHRSQSVVTVSTAPDNYSVPTRKLSASAGSRLTAKVYLGNAMAGGGTLSGSSVMNNYLDNVLTPGTQSDSNQQHDWASTSPNGEKGTMVEAGEKGDNYHLIDCPPADGGPHPHTSTTHHRPLRLGFSLRYRLNDRWSLESGITYTLLTADITTTIGSTSTNSEQRLHYVGIPLRADYRLWGNRHFTLYAAAGGMVEKMVSGSQKAGETSERLSIRPLQLSVNGAVGGEFRLNDQLSIYAEPGLGYAFDNGSSVPTYYQDKPFSFNLNLGLRFTLDGR
ncbi:MAG: outer membrane beta-barrel protein [Prevotella sp.]|nr:outer membrane beta-barrel protein [Prevotella sp.]